MPTHLFKNVCDEQFLSKLYDQYSKDLHDFSYYKYGEHFDPEDKVHEAFIKLWKNCKRVAPDKAKSFLFTVINNITPNDIKHKKVLLKHQKLKPNEHTHETTQFIMAEAEYTEKYEAALEKLPAGQFYKGKADQKKYTQILIKT